MTVKWTGQYYALSRMRYYIAILHILPRDLEANIIQLTVVCAFPDLEKPDTISRPRDQSSPKVVVLSSQQ